MAKDNRNIAITAQSSEGLLIRIIDYRSGRELTKFTIPGLYTTNFDQICQTNPDLLLLAGSNTIYLLNTLTRQITREFQVSSDDWFSYRPQPPISFAEDENLLVAMCPEAVNIWEVNSAKLLHQFPLRDVNTEDELGSLDARGSYAVYNIRLRNTMQLVDAKIDKEINKIEVNFPGKSAGSVFIKEVKMTSLDQLVMIPSSRDNLLLYDVSGNLVRELPNSKMTQGLHRLQITDDGKKVVTVDLFKICILDLETGKVERCLRNPIMRFRICPL
ncbi:hypothetical protein P5673_026283 [Acropora cervicornis]|uniref:Uncharacterized protein n=1 Tax=Acropora cervicornis TaxID=6130 RepID=A0AAD9Q1G9_ACRCE|nr:hypothetical protein P5673_026283 [Acropora cervicornis]